MAAIDETKVVGRGSVNFASEKDIDEFVEPSRQVRTRRDGARRLAALSPDTRHLRPAAGRRADAAREGAAGHREQRADARVRHGGVEVLARLRPRDDAAEHPAALRAAEGLRRRDADPGRRRADHARGVRQRGAQRDRLPLHGHVVERDLRRLSVRRGADPLLPAASAGRGAAAQVQDRVRGLHRGSRARVDQRHRLAREDPGRQARLPRSRLPAARRSCR